MKIYFFLAFILVFASSNATNRCSQVSDCFDVCRKPGETGYRIEHAACINNYCQCDKPLDICFSHNDCFTPCGVKADPSEPRFNNVICTDNGVCECGMS